MLSSRFVLRSVLPNDAWPLLAAPADGTATVAANASFHANPAIDAVCAMPSSQPLTIAPLPSATGESRPSGEAVVVEEHTDTRRRLLRAALEAFMVEGYQASTERIARRAGVSRQTLYNHFPGKQALFAAVATEAGVALRDALTDGEGDIRSRLLRFATAFRALVNGEVGIKLFRALIAEAPRMPELAQTFFANGAERSLALLAEVLAEAMARGELRRDDARFAAEMLFGMLTGIERSRCLCGLPPPAPEEEATRIARIVDLFLIAYAPPSAR